MKTPRKTAMLLGAMAIIGMGDMTLACSPQHGKTAETSLTEPRVSATEKAVRTNATRAPSAAVPDTAGGGNAGVRCSFAPAGGAPCGRSS